MSTKNISRREFLSKSATAGLGVLLSSTVGIKSVWSSKSESYDIVVGSDTHIDLAEEATSSMESFVTDVKQNLNPKQVFCLGDLVHNATVKEYQTYLDLREQLPAPVWECPGNHDHAPGLSNEENMALFRELLDYEKQFYSFLLGNNLFILLADERQKDLPSGLSYAGYMEPEQVTWFEDVVKTNQDKNVIVLSHQSPKGTTVMSDQPNMQMHPTDEIERVLNTYRVDLWFSAHAHSGFDHKSAHSEMFVEEGPTTFVQVASISKRYDTNRTQSRLLSLVEGTREVTIRSRDHDTQTFDESLDMTASLPYAVSLSTTAVDLVGQLVTTWGQLKALR